MSLTWKTVFPFFPSPTGDIEQLKDQNTSKLYNINNINASSNHWRALIYHMFEILQPCRKYDLLVQLSLGVGRKALWTLSVLQWWRTSPGTCSHTPLGAIHVLSECGPRDPRDAIGWMHSKHSNCRVMSFGPLGLVTNQLRSPHHIILEPLQSLEAAPWTCLFCLCKHVWHILQTS